MAQMDAAYACSRALLQRAGRARARPRERVATVLTYAKLARPLRRLLGAQWLRSRAARGVREGVLQLLELAQQLAAGVNCSRHRRRELSRACPLHVRGLCE